jgi:hypothetical protein
MQCMHAQTRRHKKKRQKKNRRQKKTNIRHTRLGDLCLWEPLGHGETGGWITGGRPILITWQTEKVTCINVTWHGTVAHQHGKLK